MKPYIINLLIGALALPLATGCSDSDDWTPGPADTATGVSAYFPMPTKSSVIFDSEGDRDDMNVEITVSRLLTDEAASIPVILSSDSEGFTMVTPTAEFAAGEATTTVTVNCGGIPKGEKETFSIALPDDQTDIYGEGLLTVAYTVIKAQWVEISEKVTYMFRNAGNQTFYPSTYGSLQHLEGTHMFKLIDFFGSGLDVMFECDEDVETKPDGVAFTPLNNADFYDEFDGYPGWYLYDEENDTYPEWVPGNADGYPAIQYVTFESNVEDTSIYMNDNKATHYSYIYFTTYLTLDDDSEQWGIWYATFNLKYDPYE